MLISHAIGHGHAQQVAKLKAADPAAQQSSRMVETCPQDMGCAI
jgi:hypothetical protein